MYSILSIFYVLSQAVNATWFQLHYVEDSVTEKNTIIRSNIFDPYYVTANILKISWR